ncbi:hypothetical protein [Pseudomarimonas arenosa]|uniref:Uncharacterized protein n=1 Tax=Pseudomarimonas arenosa TaxID=2774145 RepID=A0AAW3ZW71_9GAMM|nr:hypothetical protein [Pseudomarimonas arenosa]MBD8528291.1 hypothetical protein [Pseudomarimonas arenosa]
MAFRKVQCGSFRVHAAYLTVIASLVAALGFVVYNSIDLAVSLAYRDQELYEHRSLNKQLLQALPSIAEQVPRETIVAAFSEVSSESPYTKEGCEWVGWVALKFSPEGKLEHITPTWSYGGTSNPCFPE